MLNENLAMAQIIKLQIIPTNNVNSRGLVHMTGPSPAFRGKSGGFNYVCGFCNAILAEDVKQNETTKKVVQCYGCLKYNQFPSEG
jgi:hypothetical protein